MSEAERSWNFIVTVWYLLAATGWGIAAYKVFNVLWATDKLTCILGVIGCVYIGLDMLRDAFKIESVK